MSTPWPEERTEELKAHWHNGLSAGAIADEMRGGITRSAVAGKLHRLGLKRDDPMAIRIKLKRRARAKRTTPIAPLVVPPAQTAAAPTAIPEPSAAHRCGILELTNTRCRFPMWPDDGPAGNLFCGAPEADVAHGVTYCRFHSRIAYRGKPEAA